MDADLTDALLRPPPRSLAIRASAFDKWIERARPGARIEYHRGHLAFDRAHGVSPFSEKERGELDCIADHALALAAEGRLLLVQQRIGYGDCSYIAIKAKPPKQKQAPARAHDVARKATHLIKEAA